ncbi:hypothetical protein N9F34_04635 [Alphaproteobacteria bacterium]|nr:hypothetical protein [Alphaproteobacteria bacterium]
MASGVDPNRCFSNIHYSEPNYEGRKADPVLDTEPAMMRWIVNNIIDQLGGQVVRVGNPEMAPFKALDGFIKLTSAKGVNFIFQLFAISRARFMVAGASG